MAHKPPALPTMPMQGAALTEGGPAAPPPEREPDIQAPSTEPRPVRPDPGSPHPARIGRYTLVRELGRGGMGLVYLAHDEALDRPVALKRLAAGAHASRADLERFEREARAAARLSHPGLVGVHDLDWHEDECFLTMDYVQGRSLRAHLRPGEPWHPARAARLVSQVARALAAVHELGLLHRDVKPENILIRDEDDAPLLTDFGLARMVHTGGPALTRTGELLGTPVYMPPEQAVGDRQKIGPASDIYALGAVLYELLAGRKPYEGSTVSVLSALLQGPPPALTALSADLPASIVAICERAMAREPSDRYPGATALADDLDRFLAGAPAQALVERGRRRLKTALHQRRGLLGGLAGLAAVVALGFAGSLLWTRQQADARESAALERLRSMEARQAELLEAGHADEADALLQAFVNLPENQGTSALTAAWLAEAKRRQSVVDHQPALSALANAYTCAVRERDQGEALLAMAEAFASSGAWDALSASVERLRRLGVPETRLARLQVTLALGRHDLAAALQAWSADDAPDRPPGSSGAMREILARLAHVTALTTQPTVLAPVPPGSPVPGAELLVRDGDRLLLTDRHFAEKDAFPLPDAKLPFLMHLIPYLVPGQPPRLVATFESHQGLPVQAELWTLQDHQIAVEQTWDDRLLFSGVPFVTPWGTELLAGAGPYLRDLSRLVPRVSGGWDLESVNPGVRAAASDVHAVLSADLDGDGMGELVVALGAWTALDIRVLDPGAAPGDDMSLVARSRIGVVSDAVVLHTPQRPDQILAWRLPSPTNAQVFGAAPNPPPEEGLFRFALEKGRLARHPQQIVGPVDVGHCAELFSADLDGDGQDEAVCNTGSGLALLRQVGEDTWESVVLAGLAAGLPVNLDDDPELELVVRPIEGAQRWVLGEGEGTLPSTPPPALLAARREQAPLLDPALEAGRERALDVARLGLASEAARYLETLAALAAERTDRGTLQLDAARVWTAANLPVPAIDAYAAAAQVDELAPAALDGMVRLLMNEHRYDEADEANRRLLGLEDPQTRSEALARVAPLNALVGADASQVDFTVTLPSDLIVDDPLSVREREGRGLALAVWPWQPAVARLPLQCEGPRIGFRVDLHVNTTEWASGVTLGLAPAGQGVERSVISISVGAGGGGGLNHRQVNCPWQRPDPRDAWVRRALPTWSAPDDLRLEVEMVASPTESVCRAAATGSPLWGGLRPEIAPIAPGDYDLVMGGVPWAVPSPAQLARVEVQRIQIHGCTPRPAPPLTDAQRAGYALVGGDPARALAIARQVPGDAGALAQVAALLDLGQVREAASAVARRLEGDPQQRTRLMREGSAMASALLEAWGPQALLTLRESVDTNARQLPIDPGPLEALRSNLILDDMNRYRILYPEDIETLRDLYFFRGRSSLAVGDLERARTDLEAAAALPERPEGGATSAAVRVLQTQLSLLQANPDEALIAARGAISASPTPELTRERLLALPEVQAVLDRPAWRLLLEP